MNQQDKPIGDIVLVGRAAYQLYSHNYRGEVEYRADVGVPWKNKATGITKILPFMQDHSTRDFAHAAQKAAAKLEQLRQNAFTQDSLKLAGSVTPLTTTTDEAFESEEPFELKLADG